MPEPVDEPEDVRLLAQEDAWSRGRSTAPRGRNILVEGAVHRDGARREDCRARLTVLPHSLFLDGSARRWIFRQRHEDSIDVWTIGRMIELEPCSSHGSGHGHCCLPSEDPMGQPTRQLRHGCRRG